MGDRARHYRRAPNAGELRPLWPFLPHNKIALVIGFGFRPNILHLPMIFLIARVFCAQNLKKLGWWALVMMVLMVGQFRAAPMRSSTVPPAGREKF